VLVLLPLVSLQENQMEFVPGFKKWLHNTVAAEELHNKKVRAIQL